jgi:hypothetical protein
MCSKRIYTFQETMEAYREHLTRNPGKALDTGSGIVAMLEYSGDVYGTFITPKGQVDRNCAFDFDQRTFQDGHWEGQSVDETVASVVSPRLIDVALF